MTLLDRREGQGNRPYWAVNQSFIKVGTWYNCSRQCKREFVMELSVGKVQQAAYSSRVVLSQVLESRTARFTLDTGCTTTFICGRLASWLGISAEGVHAPYLTAGGQAVNAVEGVLPIMFGGSWLSIPCLVQVPLTERDDRVNCLGMSGLLASYMFCLGYDELHAFLRPPK